MQLTLKLADGSTYEGAALIDDNGVIGKLRVATADSGSVFEAEAAQRRPSANPSGYWAKKPVFCKHGHCVGYQDVWMRWCANCGKYHE